MNTNLATLGEKIQTLRSEQIAEVEDFVDFLLTRSQDRETARDAAAASNASFATVWNNHEDAAYDAL
jgi:hypothetical protein